MNNLVIFTALLATAGLSQFNGQGPQGDCAPKQECEVTCTQEGNAQNANRRGQQRHARKRGQQMCGQQEQCITTAQGMDGAAALAARKIPPARKQAYVVELQATLEKELYARDYYTAADTGLTGPPRFGNLAGAEQSHANAVANMISYLGGVPVFAHRYPIVVPSSIGEADAVCRDIELLVIDVYSRLIKTCPDPALLQTLNNIQNSNYQHLSVVGG